MGTRRRFSREFKLQAVRLVKDQGIPIAEVAQDLDLHETVLRRWIRSFEKDPDTAFPGQGQMTPEQAELAALRKENRKLKAERDILKKAAAYFASESK